MSRTKFIKIFAWLLSTAVATVAFVAWGQTLRWQFASLSSYKLFPLFGLLAFSLMWAHYIISAIRQRLRVPKNQLKSYIETTSLAVLVAIFFHPGLLIWQLWRDGFGLPPGSYLQNYVAPSMRWAATLGTVSLFVFLAYEFRRKYYRRKWWKYVNNATDLAMVAIFIHSTRLGSNLQTGWLSKVWYFYGVSLFGALAYIYYLHFHAIKPNHNLHPN